jgi:hypothetical protein
MILGSVELITFRLPFLQPFAELARCSPRNVAVCSNVSLGVARSHELREHGTHDIMALEGGSARQFRLDPVPNPPSKLFFYLHCSFPVLMTHEKLASEKR